jgi:geranylgeranyl diphosphate synthase type 3
MPTEPVQTSPLQSPTAIPPRTSSIDVVTNGTTNRYSQLGSISEGEWMSSGKKRVQLSTTSKHSRNRSSVDWTKAKDGSWTQDKEQILLGPYDYVAQQPGKDIRKQMITAFNAWLKVPESSLAIITKVVTMLHTASLL